MRLAQSIDAAPSRAARAALALQALAAAASAAVAHTALAHGVIGKRFFPATLSVDDPFVADELSLPTFERRRMPAAGDEAASTETAWSIDYTKRITEDFGVGFGASWLRIEPEGAERANGWDNIALSAKYQLWKSEAAEAIVSAGVDWDVGGTGTKRVGAESFSTVTPAIFFGKGFGDLPDGAKYLRPLALTGSIGVGFPSRATTTTVRDDGDTATERHPNVLQWGFTLQYNVAYLQSSVVDLGWREPFNRMIPIVEFALSTPLDRGGGGTTGTVNPGVLWPGRYLQLGVEAVVPVNDRSGRHTGVIAQLHFFLDDLFPDSIGRPLVRR